MAEKKFDIADRFLPRHDSVAKESIRAFYTRLLKEKVGNASTEIDAEEIVIVEEVDVEEEGGVGQPTCFGEGPVAAPLEAAVDGEHVEEVDKEKKEAAVIQRSHSEKKLAMSDSETVEDEEHEEIKEVDDVEQAEMQPSYSEDVTLSESETEEDDQISELQFVVKQENEYDAVVLEDVDLGVWYLDEYENAADSVRTIKTESTAGQPAGAVDPPVNVKECSVKIEKMDPL